MPFINSDSLEKSRERRREAMKSAGEGYKKLGDAIKKKKKKDEDERVEGGMNMIETLRKKRGAARRVSIDPSNQIA